MAYVKVGSTKSVGAVMRYCEQEKTENRVKGEPIRQRDGLIVGGVDCNPATALQDFKASRICWNKDTGIQAHLVIQSFEGQEVSSEKANELGQKLAKRYAPGHQAVVYTHSDNGNIHNHIVINAIRTSDGHKFESSKNLQKARNIANDISKEHGLSIINEHEKARTRYHQAEQALVNKGIQPWKDELREVVEAGRKNCQTIQQFKKFLQENGISINEHSTKNGITWTYQHPNGLKCRASKLGNDYTPSEISKKLELSNERVSALELTNQREEKAKQILKKGLSNVRQAKTVLEQNIVHNHSNSISEQKQISRGRSL